jgi:hypothetical protein
MRNTGYTLIAMALLAACSRTDNEPGPGGVTVSEAKALDDAAAMLESRDGAAAGGDAGAGEKTSGKEKSE